MAALKFTKEDEERLRELIRTVIREELVVEIDTDLNENYYTDKKVTVRLSLDGVEISKTEARLS